MHANFGRANKGRKVGGSADCSNFQISNFRKVDQSNFQLLTKIDACALAFVAVLKLRLQILCEIFIQALFILLCDQIHETKKTARKNAARRKTDMQKFNEDLERLRC